MTTKVWLSTIGHPVDPEQATISVFDRGFLYGDSIYETMRTSGGRIVELTAHLQRLRFSGAGIGLEVPFDEAWIRERLAETLAAAGNDEARIRLVVSRGTGPISLDTRDSESPLLAIFVQKLEPVPAASYARGISARIVDRTHMQIGREGLKTGNYLPNIVALRRAISADADDAIMCSASGAISEGATSNVFRVVDGRLETPPLGVGVLAGITRQLILLLAREQAIPGDESSFSPEQLRASGEVFLTSSVRGVMPVTRLDDAPVGVAAGAGPGDRGDRGLVGPVTRALMQAYAGYLADVGRGASERLRDSWFG